MANVELLKDLLITLSSEETFEQQIEWHIRNNYESCILKVREQADRDIGAILGVSDPYVATRIGQVDGFTKGIVSDFLTIDKILSIVEDQEEKTTIVLEIEEDVRRKKTEVAKMAFGNIAGLYGSQIEYTSSESITQILGAIKGAKAKLNLLTEINNNLTNTVEVVA